MLSSSDDGPRGASSVPWLNLLRAGLLLAAILFGGRLLLRERVEVAAALDTIGPLAILSSLVLVLLGLLLSSQAWRSSIAAFRAELPRPAARRVFFATQIGKYLPGGLWGVVGQVDAARGLGADRAKVGLGALVFVLLHVVTGLLLSALTLPWAAPVLVRDYRWALLLAVPLFPLLFPPVLGAALRSGGRVLGRWTLDVQLQPRSIVAAVGWLGATWICYGLALAVLVQPLTEQPPSLSLVAASLGGFALAWSVGVLVVLAPSGIGPREIVVYLLLLPLLDPVAATTVAIVCRLVHVTADLVLGLSGLRGYAAASRSR